METVKQIHQIPIVLSDTFDSSLSQESLTSCEGALAFHDFKSGTSLNLILDKLSYMVVLLTTLFVQKANIFVDITFLFSNK